MLPLMTSVRYWYLLAAHRFGKACGALPRALSRRSTTDSGGGSGGALNEFAARWEQEVVAQREAFFPDWLHLLVTNNYITHMNQAGSTSMAARVGKQDDDDEERSHGHEHGRNAHDALLGRNRGNAGSAHGVSDNARANEEAALLRQLLEKVSILEREVRQQRQERA